MMKCMSSSISSPTTWWQPFVVSCGKVVRDGIRFGHEGESDAFSNGLVVVACHLSSLGNGGCFFSRKY